MTTHHPGTSAPQQRKAPIMAVTRRTLLGAGTAVVLSGCATAESATPTTTSGTIPAGTPSSGTVSVTPRPVPAPRFTTAEPNHDGIDGNQLDRALAALPRYAGGSLRRVTVRPGTYRRKKTIVIPSGVHLYAAGATFVSEIPGAQIPLVTIKSVRSVIIEGGTWDGNRTSVKTRTEWKHVFGMINARGVTLRTLTAQNAKGDGIYVGTDRAACHDISLVSVKVQGNYRNGISVTSCDGLSCRDSIIVGNGITAPRAGVCVEPNARVSAMHNIEFTRCLMTGNGVRGLLVVMKPDSPESTDTLRVVDCTIEGNSKPWDGNAQASGVTLVRPRGVRLVRGVIRDNHAGILVQGRRSWDPTKVSRFGAVAVDGVDVIDNEREGLLVLNGIREFTVTDTRFLNNSREPGGLFNGILLVAGSNMTFDRCVSSGARMFGLQAAPGVSRIRLLGCDLSGNAQGEVSAAGADIKVVP